MTLIGQHARSGDNVSENSRECVKNGNADKIRWRQEVQVRKIFFIFEERKNMEPPKFNSRGLHVFCFFKQQKILLN